MYDRVVSLGYNCEVSFRIEDYYGSIDAMPFSWSFTLNRDKFPEAIRNSGELLSEGITVRDDHMLMCNKYELKFHPRYSIFPQFSEYTQEQLDEATKELKERVKHLSDKFEQLFGSDLRTLFVMKVEDKGTDSNCKYILDVYEALKEKYTSGKFTLAVVLLNESINESVRALENEQIKVFGLKKFAPVKHTNIMGDIKGWRNVFWTLDPNQEGKRNFVKRVNSRRTKWAIDTFKRKLKIKQ